MAVQYLDLLGGNQLTLNYGNYLEPCYFGRVLSKKINLQLKND